VTRHSALRLGVDGPVDQTAGPGLPQQRACRIEGARLGSPGEARLPDATGSLPRPPRIENSHRHVEKGHLFTVRCCAPRNGNQPLGDPHILMRLAALVGLRSSVLGGDQSGSWLLSRCSASPRTGFWRMSAATAFKSFPNTVANQQAADGAHGRLMMFD